MGFTARKSFKLAPGVRMTISPRGVSYSAGVKGARITRQANGRVTRTLSLPGTGIRHTATVRGQTSSASRTRTTAAPAPVAAAVPSPGLLSPKWEKALHKALIAKPDPSALEKIGTDFPEARPLAATFGALFSAIPAEDYVRATQLLAWVVHIGFDPATDPFCLRYFPNAALSIGIADGVQVHLPLDRDALGLTLAELYQQADDLSAAVAVVEQLAPSTVAAVSLAELYAELGRWQDVVDLTEGLQNDDEPSTYLLTQRGIALRELGMYGASAEALKEALRLRSRPAELRQRALAERGSTYLAAGKIALARKDFDKVYAENTQYPGLRELLDSLPK
jgi:tetratricopeptide (TPR) repeat protein